MKIIISVITTFILLLFIYMIIYLFPDKNIEKFSDKIKNLNNSKTIEEPISDSLIPFNPYSKFHLNEYEIIETVKYILKRSPTIPEINKFMYYTITELKEFLYNSTEYEKLVKIQNNIYNDGMEGAIAKKNLINRIMELYKNIYNTDVPVKMILPLKDCFIYLQLNIYLFTVMLENSNYSFFENSVLSSYILTKKILLELFNKYYNVLELKIYAEEKINKLSNINDANGNNYIISKIEIANIIKEIILINNDYLIIKIKSNYPNVFSEILKNTIGIDNLSIDNSDIIKLKKYLSDLYNSQSSKIVSNNPSSNIPVIPYYLKSHNYIEKYDNKKSSNADGGYKSTINYNKSILDYYATYKKNKDNMVNDNSIDFYIDFYNYGFYYYLRNNSDYPNKAIFNYYDTYKKNKDNMNINDLNYYENHHIVPKCLGNDFDKYLQTIDYINNDNIENNVNIRKSVNTDLPFKNNYMNDLIYDEDNRSVLRLYNPIVHNKSYLLPSGYRPPVCTSLGQEQLTQPVFTESKLLFQGLDINKAFTETQVGSIMPKFIYNEFKDIKIK